MPTWEERDATKELEMEKVKEFVERNKVKADNSRLACSDGRYTPEQSNGAIRIFGADFGVLAAVVSAADKKKSTVSEGGLLARYALALQHHENERDGNLYFHTDKHNESNGIGCGHIKRLVEEEEKGDLFIKFRFNKPVVLEGEHEEKGVLLVYSDDWSVNSFDGSEMYFVVDMKRAKDFIFAITPKLSVPQIEAEDVWNEYQEQMKKSAQKLALGKPQFKVDIDKNGISELTSLEKVA